jgi:hypothetical protein
MAQQGYVNYVISEDGAPVAEIARMTGAACVIEGTEYRMTREPRQRFAMHGPAQLVAVAERVSGTHATISGAQEMFDLHRFSRWRNTWELHDRGQRIGTCRLRMMSATADLPTAIPLPLRVFVLYTVTMFDKGIVLGT